jgi:hypothetical protein
MRWAFAFLLLGTATLAAQDPQPVSPPPTGLPGKPFFIKKTWIIGGQGNWDYLTIDPPANRLYIAHHAEVQVVDTETGNLVGAVKGLREAHAIALDTTGEYGFISDGLADEVVAFDRRSLEVQAHIPIKIGPRALVFEPQTGMLIAVSPGPDGAPPPQADPAVLRRWAQQQLNRALGGQPSRPESPRAASPPSREAPKFPCSVGYRNLPPRPWWESLLTVIDPETNAAVAEIAFCGHAGAAAADSNGAVYAALGNNSDVLRFDIGAVLDLARAARSHTAGSMLKALHGEFANGVLHLDLREPIQYESGSDPSSSARFEGLSTFSVSPGCHIPRALAADGAHQRLFAACDNRKLSVVDSGTGKTLASLSIGPGVDAIGFDPGRGYIYSANGGAQGSLTIIRQDVTDTYSVVQTLATRQRARTLAVNSSTGEIYLVTVLEVAKTGPPPANGIGTLETVPEDSSFQVLVVGN